MRTLQDLKAILYEAHCTKCEKKVRGSLETLRKHQQTHSFNNYRLKNPAVA